MRQLVQPAMGRGGGRRVSPKGLALGPAWVQLEAASQQKAARACQRKRGPPPAVADGRHGTRAARRAGTTAAQPKHRRATPPSAEGASGALPGVGQVRAARRGPHVEVGTLPLVPSAHCTYSSTPSAVALAPAGWEAQRSAAQRSWVGVLAAQLRLLVYALRWPGLGAGPRLACSAGQSTPHTGDQAEHPAPGPGWAALEACGRHGAAPTSHQRVPEPRRQLDHRLLPLLRVAVRVRP